MFTHICLQFDSSVDSFQYGYNNHDNRDNRDIFA